MTKIQELVRKIREAVYGLDVREAIAGGIEGIAEAEEKHRQETEELINNYKEDTDNKINNQNDRIDDLNEHYNQVIQSGGDSVLEIVDARVPFNTLKEKLNDLEEKSLNVKDITLGAVNEEENRTLKVINNEGELVGLIDKDNTTFTNMEIANLTCQNVISTQSAVKLYVNGNTGDDANDGLSESKPLLTIMEAVNRLSKYLKANVYIYIAGGTYNEKIFCDGFCGAGSLYFQFSPNVIINGEIYVNSCTTAIRFNGDSTVLNHTTTRQSAYTIYTTPYAYMNNFVINGNSDTKYCVEGNQGGSGAIKSSTLNNSSTSAIVGFECSNLYIVNCIGSGHAEYSIYSASGSTICIYNKIPDANKDNWNTTGIIHGTATKTPSVVTEKPVISSIKTYSSKKQLSYRGIDGWSNRVNAYQGQYDSSKPSTYNHYGVYVLDSSTMKTDLNGKTIEAVKLTLKRYKEGQGIGQATSVNINIYGSTTTGTGSKPALSKKYVTASKIAKNQTFTVTLPNSFINDVLVNGINSLVLHTTDGSNYCKMDSTFQLEITYK